MSTLNHQSAIAGAVVTMRRHLIVVAVLSAAANLLLLTGPLFMLQVYDRVLSSGSIPTLAVLTGLVVVLFGFLGLFEWLRMRIMARLSVLAEERLFGSALETLVRPARKPGQGYDESDPVRDVETLRQYLANNGPMFLFDLPWLPIFLLIVFLLHPLLGVVATLGAALLFVLTLVNERSMGEQMKSVTADMARKSSLLGSVRQNSEVVTAMGMAPALIDRFNIMNGGMFDRQMATNDTAASYSSAIKSLRLLLQSLLLAVGAALAVFQEVTPGVMIAASIIAARALSPVEQAVGGWRHFIQFRRAWDRLSQTLAVTDSVVRPTRLPAPKSSLRVNNLRLTAEGVEKPILDAITFKLDAGQALGVVGPSASGKTSLARAVTGIWRPAVGEIRLDGAALDQWSPEALGRHVGYLPQTVELFHGTVAENIGRFSRDARPEDVIAAAQTARVHDLILSLPKGYDTPVGAQGAVLSAGQRQRIGLARALFQSPFLIVLDEPNANLDAEGEDALVRAIRTMRSRGSIVLVMAHRPSVIAATDLALVLSDGVQRMFGPKDEVLSKVLRPVAAKRSVA